MAWLERLGSEARGDELRVGLLIARHGAATGAVAAGNQREVLDAMRREVLSGAEVKGAVDLWLGCSNPSQQQYILARPRDALSQAEGMGQPCRDPRYKSRESVLEGAWGCC